jgi:hypothetical protein
LDGLVFWLYGRKNCFVEKSSGWPVVWSKIVWLAGCLVENRLVENCLVKNRLVENRLVENHPKKTV